MSLLSDVQAAAVKMARARAWTRSFTLETIAEVKGPGYYSAMLATGSQVFKGDWTWKDQHERRGSEGGVIDRADLILCTDILFTGALVAQRSRVVVDGIRCTITALTPYPQYGEVVVAATRAQ